MVILDKCRSPAVMGFSKIKLRKQLCSKICHGNISENMDGVGVATTGEGFQSTKFIITNWKLSFIFTCLCRALVLRLVWVIK